MKAPSPQSISAKLKAVAQERSVPYALVLTEFLIERMTARLTGDPILAEQLVFKGGFVGLKVYNSIRYTTDLDAISQTKPYAGLLEQAKNAVISDLGDGVWFWFEAEIDLATQNEYGGTRLQFRSGLGEPPAAPKKAQVVSLDIGFGDPVTPKVVQIETAETIGDGFLSWQVYPVETIIAEKLHPFVSLGAENSRSKDIFDLAFYLPKADKPILQEAILATFRYRGNEVPESFAQLFDELDTSLIRRGWASATFAMATRPDFESIFAAILEELRRSNL